MESSNLDTTEEIVIVGSRYGALADIVKPLFEKGEPIKKKDIKKILGGDEVILYPDNNEFDKFSVGVHTRSHRLLGHVWSSQSPAIAKWMAKNKRGHISGRIIEIITKNGLMIARLDIPLVLERVSRGSRWDDCDWANDLPEVFIKNENSILRVCIELLKDDLVKSTEWNEGLQYRIENLKNHLHQDLSAHCNDEGHIIFQMMNRSKIEEVRARSYDVADAFIKRGATKNTQRWVNEWLPQYQNEVHEGYLMKMFEAAAYDLERVEETLQLAPERLFYYYQFDKGRFASALYYADLPDSLYYRLLTLLAVWEAKRNIGSTSSPQVNVNSYLYLNDERDELFHFIHPEIEYEEALRIHVIIKRLVAYQKVTEICEYLHDLKKRGKVMLPSNALIMYNELIRMGMPSGDGYTEKNFRNYYFK